MRKPRLPPRKPTLEQLKRNFKRNSNEARYRVLERRYKVRLNHAILKLEGALRRAKTEKEREGLVAAIKVLRSVR